MQFDILSWSFVHHYSAIRGCLVPANWCRQKYAFFVFSGLGHLKRKCHGTVKCQGDIWNKLPTVGCWSLDDKDIVQNFGEKNLDLTIMAANWIMGNFFDFLLFVSIFCLFESCGSRWCWLRKKSIMNASNWIMGNWLWFVLFIHFLVGY